LGADTTPRTGQLLHAGHGAGPLKADPCDGRGGRAPCRSRERCRRSCREWSSRFRRTSSTPHSWSWASLMGRTWGAAACGSDRSYTPLRLMLMVQSFLQLVSARLVPLPRKHPISKSSSESLIHSWSFRVIWRSRTFWIWFMADRDRMDRMDRMLMATGRLVCGRACFGPDFTPLHTTATFHPPL